MNKTTILGLLCVLSTTLAAQSAYLLPFQELFSGITPGTEYDQSSLNETLSTQGWLYNEPMVISMDKRTAINCKTRSEGGLISTPEITVAGETAIALNFVCRMVANDIGSSGDEKRLNNLQRNIYAVIGNDTIFDQQKVRWDESNLQMQNFLRALGTYIYEGDGPLRIKFFATNSCQGVWENVTDGLVLGNNTTAGNNTGVLINILNDTDNKLPAFNIAYGENIDLGTIDLSTNRAGSVVQKSFLLKGINLIDPVSLEETSVNLNDDESTSLKLPVKSYTSSNGTVNEMVSLNITVPEAPGTYKEKVSMVAAGIGAAATENKFKSVPRTIWLNYTVTSSTGLTQIESKLQTYVTQNQVRVVSPEKTDISIYTATGSLLDSYKGVNQVSVTLPKGVYVFKTSLQSWKVVL